MRRSEEIDWPSWFALALLFIAYGVGVLIVVHNRYWPFFLAP